MTLIAKAGFGATIGSAAVLGVLAGCALGWLVFSTHLPARYPPAGFAPYASVLGVYIAVVLSVGRSTVPFAVRLVVAVVGALVALLVGSVLIEMILCHYDRYACFNL